MKTTILKTTLAAMTISLLTQSLFASEQNYSEACCQDASKTAITIDVNKFTHVWMNLHNNHSGIAKSQIHLQKYLENALQNKEEPLDVEKFAALWDKAGNRSGQDHLTKKMAEMVEKAKTGEACYYATETHNQK